LLSPSEILDEIRGHLGAALAQTISSDDPIIIGHVRDAYLLAGGRLEWLSSQSPTVQTNTTSDTR
jgi:hypothetical protein